jgi:hypothetical protein
VAKVRLRLVPAVGNDHAHITTRFRRLKGEKVEPLLATLAALSLVRHTPEGYAV